MSGAAGPPAWRRSRLVLAAVALVLVGLPWGFKLALAPSMGAACGGGFDCAALDGRCVQGREGKYCTRVCERDSDCSKGRCGVPPHDSWQVWFSASPISERVCVPDLEAQTQPRGSAPESSSAATSR